MSMILPKPLALMDDAEVADWLRGLILGERLESVELDYKAGSIKVATTGDKKEFAADISSFANCIGGTLVYGVKEAERPTQDQKETVIYPLEFEGAEFDDELLCRAEQVMSDNIEPRLPEHPTIRPVKLTLNPGDPEKWAIVIEVRKSWTGPHMVTADKEFRYYTRQNFRKGPVRMDHRELSTLFEQSLRQTEKVAQWIAGRDTALYNRRRYRGPSDPVLFMLVVPHTLIDNRLDISDYAFREWLADPQHNPYEARFQPSLYGLQANGSKGWEVQLHRNLAIEYLWSLLRLLGSLPHVLGCDQIVDQLTRLLMLGKNLYDRFGYDGPLRLKMDLIQGTSPDRWRGLRFQTTGEPQPWPDPALSIIEDVSALELETEPKAVVKRVLDRYFQAFGHEEVHSIVIDRQFQDLASTGFAV
jgi:hypothetical protein